MPYYYGYGFGIDPLYLLVVLVCTVLGLAAQSYINSTYKTWSKVRSDGDTGATVARRMLDANGCNAVGIKGVAGELTTTTTRRITTCISRTLTVRADRSQALPWPATRRVMPPSVRAVTP